MIRREDVDLDSGLIDDEPQGIDLRPQPGAVGYSIPREFRILDPTAPGGVVTVEPRPEWLATISAGYKVKNDKGGYPAVSRDGTIHIPDDKDIERAPELAAALKATGGKSLTIAFCSDDLNNNIVQRFVHYSASSLDIFGDETSLTHVTATAKTGDKQASLRFEKVYAGSEEYARLAGMCKAETSVLFALAEWTPQGEPRMVWTGGFGRYRIRFTSRNSLQNILSYLMNTLMPLTKGCLAGIPLELTLGYRDVAGPDPVKGWARHNIPIWELRLKVPGGLKVDPFKLKRVVNVAAINAAPLRALPPPSYTVEHALLSAPESPEEDLDTIDLTEALARTDPPCDAEHYRKHWHAMVADDPLLSTEKGRHQFVAKFTATRWPDSPHRHTESLEAFLGGNAEKHIPPASESEASDMLAQGGETMTALKKQRQARRDQSGQRQASTTTVEPEPDKGPPSTEPDSALVPSETPSEPEQETPIAAQEAEPAASEQPVEGEFHEEEPSASDSSPSNEEQKEEPAGPAPELLATEKQKQEIRDYAPPLIRNAIDFDTITFDEAALTLESIGRGGKR